jgi:hypothetical protein
MVTIWDYTGERGYYEKQFGTLRSFEEVDSLEESNVINEEDDLREQKQSEFAILLALKVGFPPSLRAPCV